MVRRSLWFLAGWLLVVVGLVGFVLPGLPGTLPMILALGCFARSSRRFHDWLYFHRLFGPPLQRWRRYRVIPPAGKAAAVAGMSGSVIVLTLSGVLPTLALAAVTVVMLGCAIFVLCCPGHPPGGDGVDQSTSILD